VQPMIGRGGIELILGSSIDSQFGPVLLFGAGGELVEFMDDRALGLPPLTLTLARRLMEQTNIFRALAGARGRKAVDVAALAQLLVSFSRLVAEQRWIAEIDINPLLVSAERLVALDARVILHPPGMTKEQFPRLAIRPYPAQYVSQLRLKDDSHVTLRPIRPEDEEMLVAFHSTLSDNTVRFRYFGLVPLKTRVAHDRLVRICFADYDREIAIVAEREGTDKSRQIIGVGRLNRLHGCNEAEFAVVVSDCWQGHGLGTRLLEALTEVGRAEKFTRIKGTILAANQGMLKVCRRIGFKVQRDAEGEFTAEFPL
jgi:acetyltransferase